jgi:hypothetical protein
MKKMFLVLAVFVCCALPLRGQTTVCDDCWVQTELYFGTDIPGGGKVSRTDWKKFVSVHVMSAFPDGATILKASGKWKDTQNGQTVTEKSRVLVVLYPASDALPKDALLQNIADQYVALFKQQAVMRVDTSVKARFYSK